MPRTKTKKRTTRLKKGKVWRNVSMPERTYARLGDFARSAEVESYHGAIDSLLIRSVELDRLLATQEG